MAENNRNRQDAYRQPHDWNDNYGWQRQTYNEEPNYTISENRGYRNSGRNSETGSGDGGWKSRYEREMDNQRSGDFSEYNQRRFGNRENRLGGGNYDAYGDRGRYDESPFVRGHGGFSYDNYSDRSSDRGRDLGRSNYGERYGGRTDYENRNYGGGENEERSWWDRTTDEVSSWFGDDEAGRRREKDRNFSGQYRGKGPRNYSRSDERIKEDINDRLSDDPFVDASDIDVTVSNGDVTLAGTVDHRSTKRRAEDLADSVSGVKNVENRLRVSQSISGTSEPSGISRPQTSAPIPGADRSRRETTNTNK